MRTLHSGRSEQGYASPDHATTADLYNLAIQYGYGALWHRPDLDRRQRLICALATFTALDGHVQLGRFVRSALDVDLTREEIVEVLMQTAPYSGFPRALNALVIAGDAMA
jgi:alkylhydroperoxidase/carboxymuconolactone decarboxylase family protein YurZ